MTTRIPWFCQVKSVICKSCDLGDVRGRKSVLSVGVLLYSYAPTTIVKTKAGIYWASRPSTGASPGINSALSAALSARRLSKKVVKEETTVCYAGWVEWSVFSSQPLINGLGKVGKKQRPGLLLVSN